MATGPVNSTHDLVLQDPTTGAVDYLQFSGMNLIQSRMVDYGIGPVFHVATAGDFNGDGIQDLLIQKAGQVDFLFLNAAGALTGSALSPTFVPTIVGSGNFGTFAGQTGPTVVSQLADGTIDLLGYNSSGVLIGSQTIAGTTGFAHVVAVGGGNIAGGAPEFVGVGAGTNSNITIQLADGTLDVLGFTGNVGTNGGITFTHSLAIAGTAGLGHVVATNQDFGNATNANILGGSATQTAEFTTQSSDGHLTNVFVGTGYGGAPEGQIFAQDAFTQAFPGFNVVDAGKVAHGLNNTGFFPIT